MIGIKRKFTQLKNDEESIIKKRKINMIDFEEIEMKTAIKSNPLEKENNMKEVVSSMDKMEIKRTSLLKDFKDSNRERPLFSFDANKGIKSDKKGNSTIKPNFSYSTLKTETRCNFKKSFEQIIKSNPDHKKIVPNSSLNRSYDKNSHRFSTSIDTGITKFHPRTEEKKRPVSFLKQEENQTPKFPCVGSQSGEKKNYFIPCYKANIVKTEIQMKRTFKYF